MKRNSLFLLLFVCSSIYFVATSSSNGRATAANAGNTGAPGESQVCGNCHNGGAFGTVSLSIQLFQVGTTTPVSAYVPGTTYDVRVTVQNSGGNPVGYGFQLTCLTTPGNSPLAGYTNLATNVKQKTVTVGSVAGRTYVEHNGVLPNNQFNFRWTAPVAGTGSVRMFAAGNAVNGNSGTSLDNSGSTNITIPEAQQLTVSSSSTNPTCSDASNGTINVTINSGNAPYTFLWNDGSVAEDRSALGAGNYSVTITDNLGLSQNLSFNLVAPSPIVATLNVQNAPFFGGNGSLELQNLSGGTPPYSTQLTPAADLSQIPAGNYLLTITDAANCESTFGFFVTSPADLEVEAEILNVSCAGLNDGQISPSLSGGVPPYTFLWDDGVEDFNRTFLSAGAYTLNVTDNVGYSKTFTFDVEEPEPLEVQTSVVPISCFGGEAEITITATGGNGSYQGIGVFNVPAGPFESLIIDSRNCSETVQIDIAQPEQIVIDYLALPISCTGETGMISFTVSGGVQPFVQTLSEVEISSPGLYNYLFIDANNCSSAIDVNVPAIDGFEIDFSVENNTCFNSCDGSISVSAPNAQGNPTFTWENGSTDSQLNSLCSGTYVVAVTDENNCTISSSITVLQPEPLALGNFQIIETTDDGVEILVPVAGGTEPYEYAWTTGANTSSALIPFDQNHELTVTDANGCVVTNEVSFFFVNQQEFSESLPKIYPNPSTDFVIIENIASGSTIQFMDLTGRVVLIESIVSPKTQIDISSLEQGNYVVRIFSKNQEFTYRMNIR